MEQLKVIGTEDDTLVLATESGERFALAEQPLPNDEGWTGAEVRACCRLASLLGVPLAEAAKNVVPVAATAAESVRRLREWAQSSAWKST